MQSRRPLARPTVGVALALAVVLVLAACGSGGTGADDIEADISSTLGTQVGVSIQDVQCPDSIPSKPGATFTCTAFVKGGAPIEVPVTVGTGATFEWKVEASSHSGADVVAKVQPQMREELNDPGLKLTCPDNTVVSDGGTIDCTAVDSQGLQESVAVEVNGADYLWQVVGD